NDPAILQDVHAVCETETLLHVLFYKNGESGKRSHGLSVAPANHVVEWVSELHRLRIESSIVQSRTRGGAMRRLKFILILSTLALLSGAAGAADVKFAYVGEISGSIAVSGGNFRDGIVLAMEEINAKG